MTHFNKHILLYEQAVFKRSSKMVKVLLKFDDHNYMSSMYQ